jgi:hypothetical protein
LSILALGVLSASVTPAVDDAERIGRALALLSALAPLLAAGGEAPKGLERAVELARAMVGDARR